VIIEYRINKTSQYRYQRQVSVIINLNVCVTQSGHVRQDTYCYIIVRMMGGDHYGTASQTSDNLQCRPHPGWTVTRVAILYRTNPLDLHGGPARDLYLAD
jgi:hypothetical protein